MMRHYIPFQICFRLAAWLIALTVLYPGSAAAVSPEEIQQRRERFIATTFAMQCESQYGRQFNTRALNRQKKLQLRAHVADSCRCIYKLLRQNFTLNDIMTYTIASGGGFADETGEAFVNQPQAYDNIILFLQDQNIRRECNFLGEL